MNEIVAGIAVPQTPAAVEATRLVEASLSPLLFHHSRRVFLLGALHAEARGLEVDAELLYLASVFHDTGLAPPFAAPAQRFEIDGADRARAFLLEHGFGEQDADLVWQAIALHTTPAVPARMAPVIAATNLGVLTDVVGFGLVDLDPTLVDEVVTRHPRGDFKHEFPRAYFAGQEHRPETTYGTVNADVVAHFMPGYRQGTMLERIQGSAWPA
jgi:hypothetical protein